MRALLHVMHEDNYKSHFNIFIGLSACITQPRASSVAALHCWVISLLLGACAPSTFLAWATTLSHSLLGTGGALEQAAKIRLDKTKVNRRIFIVLLSLFFNIVIKCSQYLNRWVNNSAETLGVINFYDKQPI